jgi:DNA primase
MADNSMTIDDMNATLGQDIELVLEMLEIDVEDFVDVGDDLRGPCCCHGGDNPTGFSYYRDKNCWFCWTIGCHAEKGSDIIGLIAAVKDIDRRKAIPAARKMVDELIKAGHLSGASASDKPKREKEDYCKTHLEQDSFPDHLLDRLGSDLSYATRRGFDESVLREMGVGVSRYGVMDGRLVFPVKNIEGKLVGFSGRQTSEDPHSPKWRHSRFKKSVNMLNIDICKRAIKKWRMSTVIASEGPWDVARLCEAGFWNSLGIMGSSITSGQIEIMKRMGATKVILFMDNDPGGRKNEENNVKRLNKAGMKTTVIYPPKDGQDVGDMEASDIKNLLRGKR